MQKSRQQREAEGGEAATVLLHLVMPDPIRLVWIISLGVAENV